MYQFFTESTARTFKAVAACVVPGESGSAGADEDVALLVADAAIAARPIADRKLLEVFLKVVERLPWFRYGRPFSRLGGEQRVRFLRFLESARLAKLRQGFFGLKTFALLGYYGSEVAWPELDYPGPRQDAPYYRLRTQGGSR